MSLYYEDGSVSLYHGDCLEEPAWQVAEVLVTDPPYGIHHAAHGKNDVAIAGEFKTGRSSTRTIPSEHMLARDTVLKAWGDKPAMVFGSWRAPRPDRTMMRLVWDKEAIGMGGVGVWRPSDEEIYLLNWPNPKARTGASNGSVIRSPALRGDARPDHPTPKPVALMESLIAKCPDGMIADPFAGSGSTLVAARNLGRTAVGVEVEERYCEMIATRLSQQALFEGAF